jgi:hypothetical protein
LAKIIVRESHVSISRRDGAEKAEGLIADVLELVLFVRRDIQHIPDAHLHHLRSHQHKGLSPEDVDPVVVIVSVEGGLSAGRNFIVAQAEVDSAVAPAEEDALGPSDSAALLIFLDRRALPFVVPILAGESVQNAHRSSLIKGERRKEKTECATPQSPSTEA